MRKSSYSNSAYGRMRDRIAKKAKETQTISVKKYSFTPYKTVLANL